MRDDANNHILGGLKAAMHEILYEVTGLDFGNGTEFLTKAVIKWAAEMEIFFTRSWPYKENGPSHDGVEEQSCAARS